MSGPLGGGGGFLTHTVYISKVYIKCTSQTMLYHEEMWKHWHKTGEKIFMTEVSKYVRNEVMNSL